MDAPENAKRPTWPKHWHHCVRLLVAAFVATLVVLLWVLAFHMRGSARSATADSEASQAGRRCSSGRCKETARLLKSFRSNHTSACVDFYEHVCAGVHDTAESSAGSTNFVVVRQLAAAATASIVKHALAQGPPRLQQTAGQKASAFLRMCKTRELHHEDNLSALRSYVEASGLFREAADFNPLVKTAEHLFVLGLPVFYQVGVDDAFVWRRSRLLTVEVSAVTVLWLKTQRAFSSQVSYTKHVLRVLLGAGIQPGRAEALSSTIPDLEDVVHAAYREYLVEKSNNSRMLIVRLDEQASLFSNDMQTRQEWSEFVAKNVTTGHPSPVYVFMEEATANFFKKIFDKLSDAKVRTLIAWEVIRDIVIVSGVVPFRGHYTQWYCIQKTLSVYGHGLTVPYFQSLVTSKKLRKIGNIYANIKYYMTKVTNTSWWLQGSDPRKFVSMAIYNRKTNALFLSGSSSFTPALDPKGPVEVNYGFFGRIVAQGIMRVMASFADGAHRTPRYSDFWTNDTRRNLREVTLCLGEQAGELEESSAEYKQRLHRLRSAAWTKARGETSPVPLPVVLEALGLVPLYEAYVEAIKYDAPYRPLLLPGLEDLSEERLFFFTWCYSLCSGERTPQGRALGSLRCNLAVANQAPFIDAFACHSELPMNPSVKCTLW
ncbi:hypothetical protein HPB52_001757 [Rhipicephalus sanguineus]|uniref:Peptidase M13 N-terminal domain-containing protein n=1 Tax=Rhipicephalus sanguineus TaxID=34632 RepID=A0A9D4QFE7_RHISA|nr:hypothetical protein HPB52_001757 [Rhipicephalus sanguineus]